MNFVNSSMTTVSMLPVCECGQVIPDLVLDVNFTEDTHEYKHPLIAFFPMCCPNCGKYIECLQVDGKYIDMFNNKKFQRR